MDDWQFWFGVNVVVLTILPVASNFLLPIGHFQMFVNSGKMFVLFMTNTANIYMPCGQSMEIEVYT